MSSSRPEPRHVLVLVLAAACWGTGTALSKQAVTELPPLTLLAVQLLVSLTLLGVIAHLRREPLLRGRAASRIGRLGLLNPGLAYALSLLGLAQITASLSVLLWALEPVLIVALAVLLLGERPGWFLVGLAGLAILGVGLVAYDPAATGAIPGIVLTMAGVACCAVYTVATRRWLPEAPSTIAVVVVQQAYALAFAAVLLVLVGALGQPLVPSRVTPLGLSSAVASGLVYYGLAYALYLTGLRVVLASTAAMSFYLIPVFGVAAAGVFGDRLASLQWIGALVVVTAVAGITVQSQNQGATASADR